MVCCRGSVKEEAFFSIDEVKEAESPIEEDRPGALVGSIEGCPELATKGKANTVDKLRTKGTVEVNIVLSLNKTMPVPGMDYIKRGLSID